jgi:hypothetical protein
MVISFTFHGEVARRVRQTICPFSDQELCKNKQTDFKYVER